MWTNACPTTLVDGFTLLYILVESRVCNQHSDCLLLKANSRKKNLTWLFLIFHKFYKIMILFFSFNVLLLSVALVFLQWSVLVHTEAILKKRVSTSPCMPSRLGSRAVSVFWDTLFQSELTITKTAVVWKWGEGGLFKPWTEMCHSAISGIWEGGIFRWLWGRVEDL